MADPLFVILVSGRPEGGTPHGTDDTFARCAWLRVGELVRTLFKKRKKPGAIVTGTSVLRFIHFACHDSSVGIYEHDFATMSNRVRDPLARSVALNWKTLDNSFATAFGTLTTTQDPSTFVEWQAVATAKAASPSTWGKDDDPPANVSIVNAYHSIRKAPAGSIVEFSIFSHAFVDGPVLNNTDATPGQTTRTPGDSDGRASIDFQTNMGETGTADANALKEFVAAFAPTGSFRIWGCNIQDIVKTVPPEGGAARRCLIRSTVLEVVQEAYAKPLRRGGALARLLRDKTHLLRGSTMVDLDMDRQISHEVELQSDRNAGHGLTPFAKPRLFEIRYAEAIANHAYAAFFQNEQNPAGSGKFAKTISRSYSDIVKFVAAETTKTYFFAAAQAMKTVTVISGAPGTSAELESGQQFIGPTTKVQAQFFSQFFNSKAVEPDDDTEEQRHYSILDNQGTAVKTILDRAANGLP